MSNLSIRGIDPDLATTLKEQAQASYPMRNLLQCNKCCVKDAVIK